MSEQQPLDYKHEFEQEQQEYRDPQAELDRINLGLAGLDRDQVRHAPGRPHFLVGDWGVGGGGHARKRKG